VPVVRRSLLRRGENMRTTRRSVVLLLVLAAVLAPLASGRLPSASANDATVARGVAAIEARHVELGGAGGVLGPAIRPTQCGLRDLGCRRVFAHGLIYWTVPTQARAIAGDIGGAWLARGGPDGPLRYPVSDVLCGLVGGGCLQTFQGGRMYWSPSSGAAFTRGPVQAAWESTGTQDGPLSYPVADVSCGLSSDGCAQPFQRGWMFWSPATGGRVIAGDVGGAWLARGGPTGQLGYPIGGMLCGLVAGGCLQDFQGGRMYWSPTSGAAFTNGLVQSAWEATGTQDGPLG